MNWDRIEDQLDLIAGKRDLLLGRIQEAYGISRDESEKQLADWQNRMQESQSNDTTVAPAPR